MAERLKTRGGSTKLNRLLIAATPHPHHRLNFNPKEPNFKTDASGCPINTTNYQA